MADHQEGHPLLVPERESRKRKLKIAGFTIGIVIFLGVVGVCTWLLFRAPTVVNVDECHEHDNFMACFYETIPEGVNLTMENFTIPSVEALARVIRSASTSLASVPFLLL
jgi:hypothetical protein